MATADLTDTKSMSTASVDWRVVSPYLFILPAVLVMIAGLLYPVIEAFHLAFYDWDIGQDFEDAPNVGLAHFARMLVDEDVWESIWVTIRFG
ncbi:MAG: hypothetical protein ACR2QH_17375, partial [Geminicoccaceae bacterium]